MYTPKITRPCQGVRARIDHAGLGNWLYIAVEVALVAAADCTLVLPTVLHRFRYRRVQSGSEQQCEDIRCMQAASKSAPARQQAWWLGALSFEDACADLRALFYKLLPTRPQPFALPYTYERSRTSPATHTSTFAAANDPVFATRRSVRRSARGHPC